MNGRRPHDGGGHPKTAATPLTVDAAAHLRDRRPGLVVTARDPGDEGGDPPCWAHLDPTTGDTRDFSTSE